MAFSKVAASMPGPLSATRIVTTALGLVEAEGYDALTIRRTAAAPRTTASGCCRPSHGSAAGNAAAARMGELLGTLVPRV